MSENNYVDSRIFTKTIYNCHSLPKIKLDIIKIIQIVDVFAIALAYSKTESNLLGWGDGESLDSNNRAAKSACPGLG